MTTLTLTLAECHTRSFSEKRRKTTCSEKFTAYVNIIKEFHFRFTIGFVNVIFLKFSKNLRRLISNL